VKKPVIAFIASLATVGLLSGCSTASTPEAQDRHRLHTLPDSQFVGAWSVIDAATNEPALSDAPANIATDGSVELIFMFQNGPAPVPASRMLVVAVDDSSHMAFFDLTCDDKIDKPNELFSCTTGRFVDNGGNTEYSGYVKRSTTFTDGDGYVDGTAFIKRGVIS
jgi:hypothetical protein